MDNSLLDNKTAFDQVMVGEAIAKANSLIGNALPVKLSQMEVVKCNESIRTINISDATWLFRIDRLSLKKKERVEDKLTNIIKAIHLCKASAVILINCIEGELSYYVGVVNKTEVAGNIFSMKNILNSGLTGNFPGTKLTELSLKEVTREIGRIFENEFETQCITSISGAASNRLSEKDIKESVRGIENMIDSLGDVSFTLLTIADPVKNEQLNEIRKGYESLGTQLSALQKVNLAMQQGEGISLSRNDSLSFTKSISKSISETQSFTKTNGWSPGIFEEDAHRSDDVAGKVVGGIAMAAASFVNPVLGPTAFGLASSVFGGNRTQSEAYNISQQSGASEGNSEQIQVGSGESSSANSSRTFTVNYENYTIRELLKKVDESLKLCDEYSTYGVFFCASYVLSSNASTNALVANQFQSLLSGKNSSLQLSDINTWTERETVNKIKEYLRVFTHPVFCFGTLYNDISPAVLVGSEELAFHFTIPHRSVKGLPVIEFEPFAQGVNRYDNSKKRGDSVHIGQLFHMGDVRKEPILLDKNSLCMHTFVTGSTGAGKSNTIYVMLDEVMKCGVKCMIIEPAKGEYKNVFGGREDTTVYGTNPSRALMLRINPFSFPKEIHVLEHIDRLVEIFNACWPMYAAMPAILKEAIEQAYIDAGWNLTVSKNHYNEELFPNFKDVLFQIRNVVQKSDYSADNKGDYTGSLVTRVASLTNGINGQIFTSGEISSADLFDENVIVDLSRVGSVETKSLIMGILVIKMQEYRMAVHDKAVLSGELATDNDLMHLTVLEEAHNLLKKTSTEQSSDSSNLAGKAVEMLSNAIAEMRTYGEGFIIADQAPALLDKSIIRNTNTKIIMRLPDFEDRELVGKAAGVSDKQIIELARLPKGVAAIFQNDWLEPVLASVKFFDDSKKKTMLNYVLDKTVGFDTESEILDLLVYQMNFDTADELDRTMFINRIVKSDLPGFIKTRVIQYTQPKCSNRFKLLSEIAVNLFNSDEVWRLPFDDIEEWEKEAVAILNPKLDSEIYDEKEVSIILAMILFEQSKVNPEGEQLFDDYIDLMNRRGYLDNTRKEVNDSVW